MHIAPQEYQHPLDRSLLSKIQATPGVDTLVRKSSAAYNEIVSRIELLGNGVLVTPRSFPKLKDAMVKNAAMLGIKEPDLYVVGHGEPVAYTTGIEQPMIVVSTELLRRISEDEAAAILAHECGHIACDHLLWHNVLTTIMAGASAISKTIATASTLAMPLLFKWYRASEFSADRAAAVAMGGVAPIQGGLMKLMTGRTGFESELDIEEICRQADRLDSYMDEGIWKKLLGYSQRMFLTHPWTIVRVRELHNWDKSGELEGMLVVDGTPINRDTITSGMVGGNVDAMKGLEM